MRKLGLYIYLGAGLLLLGMACSVIWTQQMKQRARRDAAQAICSTLAQSAAAYMAAHNGALPADMSALEQFSGTQLPRNPDTGEELRLVELLHNDRNFDVTLLPMLWARKGQQEEGSGPHAAIVIVYGQPFYRGMDIDGDSLSDPVLACWPPGDTNAELSADDGSGRRYASLSQTVRQEEERLRKAGDRGVLHEGDKPRY
ncbi:hypothetical protein IT575_05535 [bacterium]|nr:hypothetical protein [bacterium]